MPHDGYADQFLASTAQQTVACLWGSPCAVCVFAERGGEPQRGPGSRAGVAGGVGVGLGCAGGGLFTGLLDGGTRAGRPPRDGAAADSVADATEAEIHAATTPRWPSSHAEGSADVTENDTQEPGSGPCGALGNGAAPTPHAEEGSRTPAGRAHARRAPRRVAQNAFGRELLLRRRLQLGGDAPVWSALALWASRCAMEPARANGSRACANGRLGGLCAQGACRCQAGYRLCNEAVHSLVGLLHERGLRGGPDLPDAKCACPRGARPQRCLHPVRRLLHERRSLRGEPPGGDLRVRRGHDALRRRLRGHGRLLRRRDDLRREYSVRRCVYPRRERQVLPKLQRRTVRLGGAGGLRDRSLSRRDDVRVRDSTWPSGSGNCCLNDGWQPTCTCAQRSNLRREHGVWTALLVRRSPRNSAGVLHGGHAAGRAPEPPTGALAPAARWSNRLGTDLRVCPRFDIPYGGWRSVAPMTPGQSTCP